MAISDKNYTFTITIPARKFWRVYLPAAAGISLVAIIFAILFIDTVVMPGVVGMERGAVKVPAVQGLTIEQARGKFFGVGLLTEIRSRDYDNQVPEGIVISQSPDPGSKVIKGRRVLIVVSKGPEIAEIPVIAGMSERQARSELRKNGFSTVEVLRKFSDAQPADKIIEIDPQAGSSVSRETKITIILSKGSKATTAEMPNIVGESLADAQEKIENCGLKIGSVSYQGSPSIVPGTVIAQSIPPGQNVPFELSVDITVASAK